MYFGLRVEMLKRGITNAAIAELLGTHRNTIANKLDGNGDFRGAELKKIKDTFFPDCTIDDLMKEKVA